MRAEKRHELEQNELADWLGEQIEAVKPYAPTVGFVLIGGAIAILLAIYVFGSGTSASASAWSEYFKAFNEREPGVALDAFAKEMPDKPAALWALQAVGDINLSRGSVQLFSDRELAKKSLDAARVAYDKVLKDAKDPMLLSRAKLGLAKLNESQGNPTEAKKLYEEIAKATNDTAIGKFAERAAKRLSDPREIELLAWFANQKPRKPVPGLGSGGLPGLPNDLPERPDLSLPGLGSGSSDKGGGLNLDGIGTGKTGDLPFEFPKPGETKPGEANPVEPKAADPVSPDPAAVPPAEPTPEAPPAAAPPTDPKPE